MKLAAFRRTLAAVAGTALVSSALLITASAPAPAAATQPAGVKPAASQPVLVDCAGHGKVELIERAARIVLDGEAGDAGVDRKSHVLRDVVRRVAKRVFEIGVQREVARAREL